MDPREVQRSSEHVHRICFVTTQKFQAEAPMPRSHLQTISRWNLAPVGYFKLNVYSLLLFFSFYNKRQELT